jgi:alanyl-tRNA synthetase
MMTERLYYTDAGLLAFDATVVEALDVEGRMAVVLDRTAFYPTSGGQPHDTGRLNDVRVTDVADEGDRIVHFLESCLEVGTSVRGAVDPTRRLDHRQQHTGQHVLSAAFDRVFSNRTVSFHLGAAVSTIDLARLLSRRTLSAPWTKRTASCGRTGPSRCGSPTRPRRSRWACARSRAAKVNCGWSK